MPIETVLHGENDETCRQKVLCHRHHHRLAVDAQVALERGTLPKRIIARNRDLSWGGASLEVPHNALGVDDSVVLRFPGREGYAFSAHADVIWNHRIDDERSLVGVSFSKLGVSDEQKLLRLLLILTRSGHQSKQDISAANAVEIRFLDRKEMLAHLVQIRSGYLETTLFRPVRANERIPLLLTGLKDLPTLRLRAHILWQKALCPGGSRRESGPFQVALAFDHPGGDLERVTAPLIARLRALDKKAV